MRLGDWYSDVDFQTLPPQPAGDAGPTDAPAQVFGGGVMGGDYQGDQFGVPGANPMPAVPLYDPGSFTTDAGGNVVYAPPAQVVGGGSTQPPASPSSNTFDSTLDKLVSIAVAGLKLNQAYNGAGRPSVRVSGDVAGRRSVAGRDGLLTVTDAAGRVTRNRPAPGVPWVTPDNAVVTNNGDGTYTVIDARGGATMGQYAASSAIERVGSAFSGVPGPLLLAAGLGLFALLRRGR